MSSTTPVRVARSRSRTVPTKKLLSTVRKSSEDAIYVAMQMQTLPLESGYTRELRKIRVEGVATVFRKWITRWYGINNLWTQIPSLIIRFTAQNNPLSARYPDRKQLLYLLNCHSSSKWLVGRKKPLHGIKKTQVDDIVEKENEKDEPPFILQQFPLLVIWSWLGLNQNQLELATA